MKCKAVQPKTRLVAGDPRNCFTPSDKDSYFQTSLPPTCSRGSASQLLNSSEWVREDQRTLVPFTCLATFESGQEPELDGEQSPDFLLASTPKEDPHIYLFVATLPTWKAKWGQACCYLQVTQAYFFTSKDNSNEHGKICENWFSLKTFLPQKIGLHSIGRHWE